MSPQEKPRPAVHLEVGGCPDLEKGRQPCVWPVGGGGKGFGENDRTSPDRLEQTVSRNVNSTILEEETQEEGRSRGRPCHRRAWLACHGQIPGRNVGIEGAGKEGTLLEF